MGSEHYKTSVEVFGEELALKLYERLGKAGRVSFATSDRPLNKSELQFPEDLVHKCRAVLDRKGFSVRRQIFVCEPRVRYGGKAEAVMLHQYGFHVPVIADTLAVHPTTVYRWGIPPGKVGSHLEVVADRRLYDIGYARTQEARPGAIHHKPDHYHLVGAAVELLDMLKASGLPLKEKKRK